MKNQNELENLEQMEYRGKILVQKYTRTSRVRMLESEKLSYSYCVSREARVAFLNLSFIINRVEPKNKLERKLAKLGSRAKIVSIE